MSRRSKSLRATAASLRHQTSVVRTTVLCCVVAGCLAGWQALAVAQDGRSGPTVGPQIGSVVPEFAGTDQFGRTQTVQGVLGAKGAMIVFFRSADW